MLYTETTPLSGFFLKKKPPSIESVTTYVLENRSKTLGKRSFQGFPPRRGGVSYKSEDSILRRRNSAMEIKRIGSQASYKGPADYFTGTVRVDPLFDSPDPARVVGASVTFEPGARTAWHTHPLGQTLVVTSGCGRAQR